MHPQREVPPPVPSDLADELVHLRECVNVLRRERDELRSPIDASDRWRVESRKKPSSTRQTQQFEGTGSTLWHNDEGLVAGFQQGMACEGEGGRGGAPRASADPR